MAVYTRSWSDEEFEAELKRRGRVALAIEDYEMLLDRAVAGAQARMAAQRMMDAAEASDYASSVVEPEIRLLGNRIDAWDIGD